MTVLCCLHANGEYQLQHEEVASSRALLREVNYFSYQNERLGY